MHILVPVFFHAPMGGLHHHVLATTRYVLRAGHEVTIVCKPGVFADKSRDLGARVITTDYKTNDVHCLLQQLMAEPFDLVYAHPFDSRQIGLAVAEVQHIPFVLVIHGMYDDDLPYYIDQTSHVIAVAEAIASYLIDRCASVHDKLTVLMNGVDESYTVTKQPMPRDRIRATFVSRMDADMVFPLDVLLDGIGDERIKDVPIDWTFVGTGTQREKYEVRFDDVLEGTNQSIHWAGWLESAEVADMMRQSDFVVAPSRAAIESLALGRPTIAAGSKGYHGLITEDTWADAEATNYGGIGARHASYRRGAFADEVLKLLDVEFRLQAAAFSASLAKRYEDELIQEHLLSLFERVVKDGLRPSKVDYVVARYEQLHLHRANTLLARRLTVRDEKLKQLRNDLEE